MVCLKIEVEGMETYETVVESHLDELLPLYLSILRGEVISLCRL